MNYEKKYNEALERAKKLLLGNEHSNTIRSYFEHIFPELSESEDERMLKKIIEYLEMIKMGCVICTIDTSEEIAWLKKQKEQKPLETPSPSVIYTEQGDVLAEQKPASTEDMPYITDEHFYEREPADSFKYKLAEYMTRCCTKKEGPYGYEYGISAESILKMAKKELLKRGELKEQKPVEWSERYIADVFENVGLAKIVREQGNDELTNAVQSAMIELSKGNKQEWSEEDKQWLSEVYFAIDHSMYSEDERQAMKKYIDSLRSQSKPTEWSEEDEKRVKEAIKRIDELEFLGIPCNNVRKVLESLRPSWKPSEEQMEALRNAVNKLAKTDVSDSVRLSIMYDNLKKL
jgi:hypothetical protein